MTIIKFYSQIENLNIVNLNKHRKCSRISVLCKITDSNESFLVFFDNFHTCLDFKISKPFKV